MEGDQHAVMGDVGIGLQVAVAEADRDLKRRERVLWGLTGPTTMGEGDRAGLVEERVQRRAGCVQVRSHTPALRVSGS